MTEQTHPEDEAASSYLDGEATLDEVARIEADPELLAAARELQAVADLLSTPVAPLPPDAVDRLIANALDQSRSDGRITDLGTVRTLRRFNYQRLAAVAATLVILAGAVGALIVFNSNSDEDMLAVNLESAADDQATVDDAFADDGGMAFDNNTSAESIAEDGDDMAQAMPESDVTAATPSSGDDTADEEYDEPTDAPGDTSDGEESADWAQRNESDHGEETESGFGDDTAAATTTTYHPLDFEIADSYETFDELVDQASNRWQELIAAGATPYPDTAIEPGTAAQPLAELPCGQNYINTFDRHGWGDIIDVSATTVAGSPVTVVLLDTAELLVAAEPDCTVELLATLTP